MLVPLPWKYLPQTRQAYTLILDNDTEHNFSKSKSKNCRLIVSKYGHNRGVSDFVFACFAFSVTKDNIILHNNLDYNSNTENAT